MWPHRRIEYWEYYENSVGTNALPTHTRIDKQRKIANFVSSCFVSHNSVCVTVPILSSSLARLSYVNITFSKEKYFLKEKYQSAYRFFDYTCNHLYTKILAQIAVSYIQRRNNNAPKYFILKSLNHLHLLSHPQSCVCHIPVLLVSGLVCVSLFYFILTVQSLCPVTNAIFYN